MEEVRTEYDKLSAKTAKFEALEEDIKTRADGFGRKKFHHSWSKKGNHYTLAQLKNYLMNKIIPHELEPTMMIPKDPRFDLPTNKVEFNLGTVAPDINELHATDNETDNKMKRKLTKEIKMLETDYSQIT